MLFDISYLKSLSCAELYDLAIDTVEKLEKDIWTLTKYKIFIFKTKKIRNKTIEKLNFKQLIDEKVDNLWKYHTSLSATIKIINKDIVNNGISVLEDEKYNKNFLLNSFIVDWLSIEVKSYINENRYIDK